MLGMIGEQASRSRCLVPHTRPPLPPSRWPERRVLLPPLYSGGGGQGGPARTLRRLCGSGGPGREPVWRGPKPGFPSPHSPPRGSRPTARTHPGPVALLRGSGGPTLLSDTAVTAPWHGPCWTRGDTGRNGKGAPRVGWGTAESREILALHSPLGSKEGPTPDPGPSWWPGPGAGGGERWLHAKARPPVLRRPWGPDAHALPPAGLPLLICAVSIPSATDSYGTTNK